jgi:hypothetical protein
MVEMGLAEALSEDEDLETWDFRVSKFRSCVRFAPLLLVVSCHFGNDGVANSL